MIKITNTTRRDLGIALDVIVPAGGSKLVTPGVYKQSLGNAPVKAWFNGSKLVATEDLDDLGKPDAEDDFMTPETLAEAIAKPMISGEALIEAAVDVIASAAEATPTDREALVARARALGVSIRKNMLDETIERKIADAETALEGV